jgi:hypothetical protein
LRTGSLQRGFHLALPPTLTSDLNIVSNSFRACTRLN